MAKANYNHNGIPVGYRFEPTDEEIILDYLLKKVMGLKLPCDYAIVDCDIYDGKDQWRQVFEEGLEKGLYVFSKLKKKKSEKGHRIQRSCTDCGTWKQTQKEKNISLSLCGKGNKRIGSKRAFKFIPNHGFTIEGRWLMDEYRLDSTLIDQTVHQQNEYVVCHIKHERDKSQSCDLLEENGSIKLTAPHHQEAAVNGRTELSSTGPQVDENGSMSITAIPHHEPQSTSIFDFNLCFTAEELEAYLS